MGLQYFSQLWSMRISIGEIGPRSERHLACLVTVHAHNGLSRVQGKLGSEGRATRSRNLTEKGFACKKETLRERTKKVNRRLIRKYSTIEDLMFSSKRIIAVEEGMKQFNNLFKMFLNAHQEYNRLLADEEDDHWFDDVDTLVCSFKRKVHCWLREAAQRAKSSKCSPWSSRSVSEN